MPYGLSLTDELRSRVRERIEDRRLPVALSRDMWAGYGSGRMCCVCDDGISSDSVEYEVTDPRNGAQLVFHLSCHAIWQLECVRRIDQRSGGDRRDTDSRSEA